MPKLNFELPDGYKVLVKTGEKVVPRQVLAKNKNKVQESVNIAEHLHVPEKKAGKYVCVDVGDTISEGDVIAEKKNFFGKTTAIIVSEINGTVLRYERDTATLIVRNEDIPDEGDIISPVEGLIELCNNKEIVIRTDKAVSGSRAVSGDPGEGEIFVLEESFSPEVGNILIYLDSRAAGKIVLGDTFTKDIFIKGVGIGALGFLAKTIADEDFEYLREKSVSIPVMEVDDTSLEELRQKNGQKVCIDTQSRTIIFLQ